MTNPYDEILYEGNAFAQTHPDRLATIARLFGMDPAPLERCRVLELGCGDGGNLIPIAYTLPGSECVGVDLGARGIVIGNEMVHALDLPNINLQCRDILETGTSLAVRAPTSARALHACSTPGGRIGSCRSATRI